VTNVTDKKKKFIAALEAQGTVLHACKAAGISRQTAYRWHREDPDFAEQWDEAHENAVEVVESTLYQQAIGGNTLAGFFYLKAHRPMYRDRVSIDIEQVKGEIEERMGATGHNPTLAGTSNSYADRLTDPHAAKSIFPRVKLSEELTCEGRNIKRLYG
jgi:hypothetical protein